MVGTLNLFDEIKYSLRDMLSEVTNAVSRSEIESQLVNAISNEDLPAIKKQLINFSTIYPNNTTAKRLVALVNLATKQALVSDVSADYGKSIEIASQLMHNFEINYKTNKKIICIDEIVSYDICKKISENLVTQFYKDYDQMIFPFIVSKNKTVSGRVVQCIGKHEQILVSNTYKGRNNAEIKTRYLDDIHPLNSEKFSITMYAYNFVANDLDAKNGFQTYTLLSKDYLPMDELKITGMAVPIKDTLKIGNTGNLQIATNTIFVIDYTKVIKSISDDEFKTMIENYRTHDALYDMYFSILRQPDLFEKFLLAMMFCSKGSEGFPSHIGLFGPAGCGKSKLLEAITGTFGEVRLLETTTIKGIVPNFGGNKPDPGLFIKSKRFCAVDEFLNLLVKNERIEEMRLFNSLLTHADGVSASGKHNDAINAKPTATMIFVTNFIKGRVPNFISLCEKIDVPFLSRFILYNYNDAHVEFIRNNEDKVSELLARESRKYNKQISISTYLDKYNPDAIQITDYLKDKPVIYSTKEVAKIYDEVKLIIPADSNVLELYTSRSKKHIATILDGITKYNYILENRSGDFEALPEDYELTKDIWYMIVGSWTENYNRMPAKYRERVLTEDELAVYYCIKEHQGTTLSDIEYNTKIRPHTALNRLLELKLVQDKPIGNIHNYYTWDYIPEN